LIASGAGANSRYSIGLVITAGMMVGTLFTLFVVPVFYLALHPGNKPARDKEGAEPFLQPQ